MAEIHVEPKKHTSNSSWVWILLALLAIAALVYFLVIRNNNSSTTIEPANTTGAISLPQVLPETTLYLC